NQRGSDGCSREQAFQPDGSTLSGWKAWPTSLLPYEPARKRRMQPRTYRAGSMKDALTRVRRDLGSDAVILAAREVRRRRLFGLGARSVVEVTATDRMPSEATAAAATAGR